MPDAGRKRLADGGDDVPEDMRKLRHWMLGGLISVPPGLALQCMAPA